MNMNDNGCSVYILRVLFCLSILICSGHSQSGFKHRSCLRGFRTCQSPGGPVAFISNWSCGPVDQRNGDVRLVGDTTPPINEGRVEIFHEGQWGTVCDDHFDTQDAAVVCRQLGLTPNGAEVTAKFGPGTGVIWMDDTDCKGTELRLAECSFSFWNLTDCTHAEDIGVVCPTNAATPSPTAIPPSTPAPVEPNQGNCTSPATTVRLIGPTNMKGVGVVQVANGSQWEGVCDDDWDYNDAKVICRMLCYNPDTALPGSVYFDMTNITQPMTTNAVRCTGSEASLSDCPKDPWALNKCKQSEKARVTCVAMDNSAPTRPEPILQCTLDGKIRASFSTLRDPFLDEKHLGLAEANQQNCGYDFTNETNFIVMSIPYDKCNTKRTYNATHVFYENVIKYLPTSVKDGVSTTNTYIIRVKCEIPRQVVDNKPVVPLTEVVTQQAPGQFTVNMHFFRNNSFMTAVTQFPLEIPLGEWLSAALELRVVDAGLRLVVYDCYATPSSNRNDQVKYPLFTNKCIDDDTVGFFPLNNSWFGWRYQTFKFVDFAEVHIHCDSIVCGTEEDSDECDRSCLNSTSSAGGRKKRSAPNRNMIHISSGAIIVYDPTAPPAIIRPLEGTTTEAQDGSTPSLTTSGNGGVIHVSSQQPPGGTSEQSPQVPTDSITTQQPVLAVPETPISDKISDTNRSNVHRASQVIISLAGFILFLAKLF